MPEDTCRVCGQTIQVMANKGTGLCSIICEKIETGELTVEEAAIVRRNGSI